MAVEWSSGGARVYSFPRAIAQEQVHGELERGYLHKGPRCDIPGITSCPALHPPYWYFSLSNHHHDLHTGVFLTMRSLWKPEENQFVRDMVAAGESDKRIARGLREKFGVRRSQKAVSHHRRLRLCLRTQFVWSPEEDEQLRQMVRPDLPIDQIVQAASEKIGRTPAGVRSRIEALRLSRRRVMWPPAEHERMIVLHASGHTAREIADRLNLEFGSQRNTMSILHHLATCGLKAHSPRAWTEPETSLCQKMALDGFSDPEIARVLTAKFRPRTASSVGQHRQYRLKLASQSNIHTRRELDRRVNLLRYTSLGPITLRELARVSKISPSTTRRVLHDLIQEKLVVRSKDRPPVYQASRKWRASGAEPDAG